MLVKWLFKKLPGIQYKDAEIFFRIIYPPSFSRDGSMSRILSNVRTLFKMVFGNITGEPSWFCYENQITEGLLYAICGPTLWVTSDNPVTVQMSHHHCVLQRYQQKYPETPCANQNHPDVPQMQVWYRGGRIKVGCRMNWVRVFQGREGVNLGRSHIYWILTLS